MLRQRRTNVDVTSSGCFDVVATLYKRHVPAGLDQTTSFTFMIVEELLFTLIFY